MDFLFYLSTLPIWQKGLLLIGGIALYLIAMTRFVAWWDLRSYRNLPDEHAEDYTNGQSEQAEMHKALKYPKRRKAA